MEVCFPRGIIRKDFLPSQRPELFARRGIQRGIREFLHGLVVSVAHVGDRHIGDRKITFQPVLCDVEGALNAALFRGELGEIIQLLLVKLPVAVPQPLFLRNIQKERRRIALLYRF